MIWLVFPNHILAKNAIESARVWPAKAGHILPEPDISIELSHESFGRHIHLISHTSLGAECLKAVI